MSLLIEIVAELREMFINTDELLEMRTFLDGRNQSQLLQVFLKDLLPLINDVIATCDRVFLHTSDHFLCEMYRRLRELNVWVLVNQFFMKQTESFILLTYDPLL